MSGHESPTPHGKTVDPSTPTPEELMSNGSADVAEHRDAEPQDADRRVTPGSTAGKNPPPGGDGATPDADLNPEKL